MSQAENTPPVSGLENGGQEVDQHLVEILDSITDAFINVDRQWRYTYINRKAEEVLGKKREELLGRNVWEVFPLPADSLSYLKSHEAMDKRISLEYVDFYPTSNRWYAVRLYPSLNGLSALFQDITELKQIEEERKRLLVREQAAYIDLIKTRHALDQFFALSLDMLCIAGLDGYFRKINPAFEKRLGYSSEEFLAHPIPYWLHPDDRERTIREIEKLNTGIPTHHFENRYRTKNGTYRWFGWTAIPVVEEGIMYAVARDITEQKEQEQRKDEFISMASHELKTPITSIKGFTQVLQNRFKKKEDEETLRFLAKMDGQLNKLTKLIGELLDASRMQEGRLEFRKERFNLVELVQEMVENLQGTTQTHQIRIQSEAEVLVWADKDRIGQVLINLIANAIKYSWQADTVIIRAYTDAENAVVSIQDFGVGIAEEHQQRIFERFYQVNEPMEKPFSGLGIGLYISNEIIRRHDGYMWVESRKGEGSTFSFTLPLSREEEIAIE